MGCCNQPKPLMPIGVNPPPYPGPLGNPCCPYKPQVPPVPSLPPKCDLPCNVTNFYRVVIPATMGDHTTVPPDTLEYRNVILEYEADSYVYIYSSDGNPTLISNGTGTNFNNLTNRPMYNGEAMTGLTNIPEVPTKISDMADAARIVCIENTNAQLKKDYTNLNNGFVNLTQTVDTQGDTIKAVQNDIERLDCTKQDKLVSGQNIKTVNGLSLVGEGNIEITPESAGLQPLLVSGENIKTVNGESILGAGDLKIEIPEVDLSDYYTKEEIDAIDAGFASKTEVEAKQDMLISGTTIKTVNGESVLGEGNIEFPTAKLYGTYGNNTDGALTQAFASEKLQALETASTDAKADIEGLEGRLDTAENTITELQNYADKTVQTDTKLGEDLSSTVTIIKTTDSLASSQPTDTEIPLPVASATQAGVMNTEMYEQLQDATNKIQIILGNSTVVPSLPENPTDQQISDAYKEATGQTEVPNGAKVTGPDGKTYIYNSTTQKWETFSEGTGPVEIKPFTNDAAGSIIGNDVDGGVVSDGGKGLVKGWDTVKADIANNTTAVSTAQGDITALQTRMTTAEGNITAVKTTADNATTAIEAANAKLAAAEAKIEALETPSTPTQTVEGQEGLAGIDTSGFTGGETVQVNKDQNNGNKDSIYVWNATEGKWELKGDASPYVLASDFSDLEAKVNANTTNITTNTANITANTGEINTLKASVATNTTDIANNKAAIAANTALIGDVNTLLQRLDTGAGV